jgi:hypothetical protein
MNLSSQQMQALANIFQNAEAMVELYWDTDNGEQLSRSLESARSAFPGLMEQHPREDGFSQRQPRLVIEAECPTCGPLADGHTDGLSVVRFALSHTAETGHIVILNGTTDIPEAAGDYPWPAPAIPPKHFSKKERPMKASAISSALRTLVAAKQPVFLWGGPALASRRLSATLRVIWRFRCKTFEHSYSTLWICVVCRFWEAMAGPSGQHRNSCRAREKASFSWTS